MVARRSQDINPLIARRWETNEGALVDGEEAVTASYGNCQGWMQMLCAMKAYLEHGINLREGMFR
jgi:hypothetical protein